MQLSSAPGLATQLRRLVLATSESIQFLDITADVEDVVRQAGLREGVVTIFSRHTTAAICIQEDEPLLLEDLNAFLTRSDRTSDTLSTGPIFGSARSTEFDVTVSQNLS